MQGGKSAAIVFSTSDIVRTVEWIMFGGFWTNGQICSATSRVLVHNSLYDDFIRVLCGLTGSLRIGSPLDRSTQTGPLINAAQRDKVLGFIRRARAAGARVLAGGNVPHLPAELRQGYYIQPTVIEVQDPDMEVWQEEIFGPVLTIMRFDTEETALQLANNTKYIRMGTLLVVIAKLSECSCVYIWTGLVSLALCSVLISINAIGSFAVSIAALRGSTAASRVSVSCPGAE